MGKSGIVDIDVYKSTMLKEGKSQKDIEQTFNAYHSLVEETFKKFNGESWHQMGDGAIFLFPILADAVDACIRLQEGLIALNKENENLLRFPLFVRIGVHEIESTEITDVPKDERGKFAHPVLDVAGKLQKNCPIGKIAMSMEVYNKLGIKKHLFRAALTEFNGRRFFVLRDRSIMPQEEILLKGLHEKQKMLMPSIPFTTWDKTMPDDSINLKAVDKILEESLLVILGETSSSLKGPIYSAATSDTVGMMEVMAALRAHREVRVGIDHWEDTADIASDRNIVIIGSGIVNIYAFTLNDIFHPVHFAKTEDRVLNQIIATSNEEGQIYFGPHGLPPKDSGLIIVSKSPFNLDKALLWVAGISGMGTQAVANFLRDMTLDAGSTLRKIGVPDTARPIACVVGAKERGTGEDRRLSDYYRRWRILDYSVLWMVDRKGNKIL